MGYVLSDYVGKTLLDGIDNYSDNILFIDDVFIMGIIAEEVGIARHNSTLFGIDGVCSDKCIMGKLAVMVGCYTDGNIKMMWNKWTRNKNLCL